MRTKIQAHVLAVQAARNIGYLEGGARQHAISTMCHHLRIMLGVRV